MSLLAFHLISSHLALALMFQSKDGLLIIDPPGEGSRVLELLSCLELGVRGGGEGEKHPSAPVVLSCSSHLGALVGEKG